MKFEYKLHSHPNEEPIQNATLNKFGEDGWELVAVANVGRFVTMFFKRQI